MLVLALVSMIGVAIAQETVGFDIPSQPLGKALYAFSAATGVEVMVDARLAAGRVAPKVKGVLSPGEALSMLLAGSNLVAQEFGPGTVTLAMSSPTATVPDFPRDKQRYFAAVQRAVELALCADARTAPGGYRLALKLWVGPSGEVTRARRLDTTGQQALDAALDAVIPAIKIGKSPPQHLDQPLALVISPDASATSMACMAAAGRAGNP